MTEILGELDLSGIPEDQFDPQLELRAAVIREGVVLGSTVLKTGSIRERLPFAVQFEPTILPGGRFPCPVRLLIGPNIGDLELLGIESLAVEVDLKPPKTTDGDPNRPEEDPAAEEITRVPLGTLVLKPDLYLCWIFCCRTYTIRGRVVCRHWQYDPFTGHYRFCDAPVPGATVEAYDVDCFFIWCHRDLIKSATTDINGNFTLQFRWCCLNWRPWLNRNWAVEADLFSHVQHILGNAGIPLPPVPPGPDPDPTYLQQIAAQAGLAPGAMPPGVPGILDAPVSGEALRAVLPASAELAALHVWPWWEWNDCAPDVVFRVAQQCGGQLRVIHSETSSQTRWNIPTTLNVTLLANDQACCLPVCRDPECPECLKITFVGCTPSDRIGATAGPPDLRGYGYSNLSYDRPFYGSLQIRGGVGSDVDYFKVQVSRNGGAWSDLPVPAFDGFSRSYWDGSSAVVALAPAFTPLLKNGQTVMVTRQHYEALHPEIPRFGGSVIWFDYDTLFYFNTIANPGLTPDGLYQLRFVGYTADAADNLVLASERLLPTCGQRASETVFIRVDNRAMIHAPSTLLHPCGSGTVHTCTNEPDCWIRKICVNEGTAGEYCIAACDIVRLAATDRLTVHFSVTCPPTVEDGHLGGYWLRAEYGVAQVFSIGTGLHGTFAPDPTFEVGPDYAAALLQGAPRPHWYGGDYQVTLRGSDFPECCAYLLRLRAWKRTTNGCSDPQWVHANEFQIAFTILRPELCPDVCPEQRQAIN
jgi:hypothetical protein